MVGKLYLNKAVSKRGEREKEKERKEGGKKEGREGTCVEIQHRLLKERALEHFKFLLGWQEKSRRARRETHKSRSSVGSEMFTTALFINKEDGSNLNVHR